MTRPAGYGFWVRHLRLAQGRSDAVKRFRANVARSRSVAAALDEVIVVHTADDRCCRLQPWPETLAGLLKQQGYATAAIGKWHLGYGLGLKPNERGFDYFYGFLAGASLTWSSSAEIGGSSM